MRTAALLASAALAACTTATGLDVVSRFDAYEASGPVDYDAFDAVYVAPVTASEDILARIGINPVGPVRGDYARPLGQDDVEDQTEAFREDLIREVGRVARLAEAPGPGILTIDAQLTALDANRPTLAELSAFPSLAFNSISVGDAAATVTLSEDGRTLVVIRDDALRPNLNDPGVGVGFWVTSERFYDRFSRKMAALLS